MDIHIVMLVTIVLLVGLVVYAFRSLVKTAELEAKKLHIMTDMMCAELDAIRQLSDDLRKSYDRVMAASDAQAYQLIQHFEAQRNRNEVKSKTQVRTKSL